MSDDLAIIQDLRRDADDILLTEIMVHINDVALEDIPISDDVRMIKDFYEGDRWTGIYQIETNLEKIYEVSYSRDADKFYVTTYLMTFCNKYEPPHKY